MGPLIRSLRFVGEVDWSETLEKLSFVDQVGEAARSGFEAELRAGALSFTRVQFFNLSTDLPQSLGKVTKGDRGCPPARQQEWTKGGEEHGRRRGCSDDVQFTRSAGMAL